MLNKAIINLNALYENALRIKRKLKRGVKFCAVVKANAYGHGAVEVANRLYPLVDCFAVALVEEGAELRRGGIDKDVLALTPITNEDAPLAVRNSLTVTVESKAQILALEREGKRQNKKIKIHLKYNVGMNRFGVDSLDELKELVEYARDKKWVVLEGMYSHLACPQNKKLLKTAENKFLLANNLVKSYNRKAVCHLSASGGFLMGKQFDMVRIGILLYGYKPFESDYISVRPIMKVIAPVVKKRELARGENALYGSFKAKQSGRVSIVRFGYADGLERRVALGQINNRCMDATMLNGDFNKRAVVMADAKVVADLYNTIPYEVLSKVAMRAERVYLR